MILYNVTVNVENAIEQEWIQWMKEIHIPEVMATGCFASHKFLRLLNESSEVQGVTYAIQYFAAEITQLNHYLEHHAPSLQQKTFAKYGEKTVAFRTFLEEI